MNEALFFSVFAGMRLARFGAEAWLAHWQGTRVLRLLQSTAFKTVVIGLTLIAVAGTVASIVVLWRRTRASAPDAASGNAHPRRAV